ncbi:MAG: hypothetical protein R8K47_01095 [Mariprofundaceae bacterium]
MRIVHDPTGRTGRPLRRRGWMLGAVRATGAPVDPGLEEAARLWRADAPCLLPGWVDAASCAEDVAVSHALMEKVLDSGRLEPWLDAAPWRERLAPRFAFVAASAEEHDPQAIEKAYFDALSDGPDAAAEDLWCKASWLSFEEDDASLRFRFSFGMEGFEDVAADAGRQAWAAELCAALFPESRAITENERIRALFAAVLGGEPAFVERIVYFNAPNGGAQFHHDVERGHAGVIYAQMSGETFWLACGKPVLMAELAAFARSRPESLAAVLPGAGERRAFLALLDAPDDLAALLDEPDHEPLEAVLDRSPHFVHWMCERGHAFILRPGDALLLPQRDLARCVWHSVFCLGDAPGEGLSFAVRPTPVSTN